MKRTMISLLLAFTLMGLCLWMTASSLMPNKQNVPRYKPDWIESYTVGSLDRLQIRKVYRLHPDDSPAGIPRDEFQEYGCTFCLTELTKEHLDGFDVYTAIFTETTLSS